MTKPKIFVAIPSCRDWKAEFGSSMISLTSHLTLKLARGEIEGLGVRCQVASLLPLNRELLLSQAIDEGFTHILWIDDDTKFPHEVADLLLSRDVDYVAVNMCRKKFPISPIAQDFNGDVVESKGKTGIQEVSHAGLGMCMIKLECLKDIPAPRFEVLWLKNQNTYLGEDTYLCEMLKQKGVKLYVDHDASNMVGHIGDFAYGYPAS